MDNSSIDTGRLKKAIETVNNYYGRLNVDLNWSQTCFVTVWIHMHVDKTDDHENRYS